jgi:hypothetical protein
MTMPTPVISHCDTARCGAAIFFVVVSNQAGRKPKLMPVNAAPDPGGNVAVLQDETGTWRGRVLGKDQEPAAWEARYCPHFATCTDPGAYRRRQRDDWNHARSAYAAAQRTRRAGRPAAQPAGPGMLRYDPTGEGR